MEPRSPRTVDDPVAFCLSGLTQRPPPALIVSGGIGSGKTTTVARLVAALRSRSIPVHGVLAPRVLEEDGRTTGYDLEDVATGRRRSFLRSSPPGEAVGRFFADDTALREAGDAVSGTGPGSVAVIDEVGRAEIEDRGHAAAVRTACRSGALVVLAVRTEFVDRVAARFELGDWWEHRVRREERD
ncbi:MAG: DUF2478 domain-containing protein [Candidatus Bipolaricaulota bacterium]|nr:MAG: DUF2478 domain-containing protein [Candidatus Bipolaricaulota bacterium]